MARGRKPSAKRVIDAGFKTGRSAVPYGDDCTLPPPSVAKNKVAAAAWETASRCLIARGDFDQADRLILERYAKAITLATEAGEMIEDGKFCQRSRSGWQQVTPAVMVFLRASDAASKLEKALGIGPDARRSLGRAADKSEPDELESFLKAYG